MRGRRNEDNDNDKVPEGGKAARMRKRSGCNKADMRNSVQLRNDTKAFFLLVKAFSCWQFDS